MSKRRVPVIFLLQFSESLAHSKKRLVRFMLYFCFASFAVAGTILEINLLEAEGASDLLLPATLSNLLSLLFLHISMSCFDSILMIRKDWDNALSALKYWSEVEKKGKLRFVFYRFIPHTIFISLWLYLNARHVFWSGPKVSILVVGGLIILGLMLAMRLGVWHLNLKYKDSIERELWQLKGSSGKQQSILSSNI